MELREIALYDSYRRAVIHAAAKVQAFYFDVHRPARVDLEKSTVEIQIGWYTDSYMIKTQEEFNEVIPLFEQELQILYNMPELSATHVQGTNCTVIVKIPDLQLPTGHFCRRCTLFCRKEESHQCS